ncbi:hypothetical protein ACOMHN_013686 [Nucella lapillus]
MGHTEPQGNGPYTASHYVAHREMDQLYHKEMGHILPAIMWPTGKWATEKWATYCQPCGPQGNGPHTASHVAHMEMGHVLPAMWPTRAMYCQPCGPTGNGPH